MQAIDIQKKREAELGSTSTTAGLLHAPIGLKAIAAHAERRAAANTVIATATLTTASVEVTSVQINRHSSHSASGSIGSIYQHATPNTVSALSAPNKPTPAYTTVSSARPVPSINGLVISATTLSVTTTDSALPAATRLDAVLPNVPIGTTDSGADGSGRQSYGSARH
jgi:hypothetical protein